jgi:hypothetical protein
LKEGKNNKGENKIKRRNFLYYIGAFSVGVVAFSRQPFKFFRSKVIEQASSTNSIKVRPNPDAVRRRDG